MKMIEGYEHRVASHCESGSVRNLLHFIGLDVSEQLLFGIGSGLAFAYMKHIKSPAGFPIPAIRMPMGKIVSNVQKLCGVDMFAQKMKTTDEAIRIANEKIDSNQPIACCVDMFYMKYLPPFMRIHVPFHFIILIGRDEKERKYAVSDPYYQHIGYLSEEDLRRAWETNALFANDNLLVYAKKAPDNIDWEKLSIKAMKKTCLNILLQPGIRQLFRIFGYEGLKLFARELKAWPAKYKGLQLREGILDTSVVFEEQGTGGGAFRMIYGAFLQEVSQMLNSNELKEMSYRMVAIGEKWRDTSRLMVKIGRDIPIKDSEYGDWYGKNKDMLLDSVNN